jgi:predicted RNase H-like HicB family nuclease
MEFHVLIREEEGTYWGEVKELPGCFVSGRDLEELEEAVIEANSLYLSDSNEPGKAATARANAHVDEMRVLVGT